MSEHEIQKLISDHAALQNENAILKEQLALVQEQYEWLKKQVFGRKTEQTSAIFDSDEGTQLTMFPREKQAELKEPEKITVPAHQRKKKRTHDDWMKNLKIKEEVHKIDNPVCDKCGAEMKEIGEDKVYDELVYTPAKFHIRRHIVKSYKCTKCGTNPENDVNYKEDIDHCNIIRADYPKPMIPHSFCSPEILAHIIYEKTAKAVPLHRQEKDFKSNGIPLS